MRSAVCYLFTTDELFSNQNWFLIEFITCANHWALQAVRLLEIIVNFINYGLGGGGGGGGEHDLPSGEKISPPPWISPIEINAHQLDMLPSCVLWQFNFY